MVVGASEEESGVAVPASGFFEATLGPQQSPTFGRRLVSVGTDGFAVFALQDSDSQMYWEGL